MLGICETFLNKNVDDKTINIDNYKIERKDRENCNMLDKTQGGGIIIYIADHVNYVRRKDLETPTIESIWVEIRIPNIVRFLSVRFIDLRLQKQNSGLIHFPIN